MSGFLGLVFLPAIVLGRLFVQTVLLALGQVWANKTRAMLTALGIIIGVGSVIGVVGGLTGMQKYVLGEFETFGARKMWIWGRVPDDLEGVLNWTDVKVTLYEANLLLENAPSIDILTPMCGTNEDIAYGRRLERGVRVEGVWPEWHEIEDRSVIFGRPLSRIDIEEERQVCVINEVAIEELRLDTDPTGDYLLIGGRRFLIVGVLETKEVGPMFGGGESRSEVLIPFGTSKQMNPYSWTWFMIQTDSPEVSADARAEAQFILRRHRGLKGDDKDTFGTEVMQNYVDQFNSLAAVIAMIALAIVSISLLVGGIGIMNIMLVSVSERTREIGLRKAVGARPPVVLLQFLVEAIVLCLVGGAIGVAIGQGLVFGLRSVPDMPLGDAQVPPWAIFLALGFSASVGVIFGMFPAIKAARLNPIDALRHE
ncbi:MAG: ABC transporter permease [Planctomycetota bacterium]